MKTLENIKQYLGLVIVLLLAAYNKSAAQIDPHFSQYYTYSQWLNPAMTGVVDGDYRAAINLKQQWGSINNSFLTGGASFEKAPAKNFAFGATVLSQKAGDLDFNYLTALVSASYRIRFGAQGLNMISFGLQGGIINRSFDLSNARFGDQFDGMNGYNAGVASGESFASTSSTTLDVNAGVLYFDANPDQIANPFFGVSLAHINRPSEKFLGADQKVPMRFTVHGGTRLKVSESVDLMPNALFMYQGNAREISAGGYAQIATSGETVLLAGANYRFDDAAVAYVGVQLKNLAFGLSYDVNTSSLSKATRSNGGLELSVTLLGKKGIFGPNFFCPRL